MLFLDRFGRQGNTYFNSTTFWLFLAKKSHYRKKFALAKYLWNVLKNCSNQIRSNEIRIRWRLPVNLIFATKAYTILYVCHHNLLLNTNLKLGQNFTTKPVEKTLLTFKKWAWNMQTACHNDGPMAGMYPQGRPVITSLYGNCKMF